MIGKENIEDEFKKLLASQPSLIKVIPILLATREKNFRILTNYVDYQLEQKTFFFNNDQLSDSRIEDAYIFAKNTGIIKMLENKKIKSIPDYVIGVEVGLDSNGRKNRHGSIMQHIVENYIKKICINNHLQYMSQANSKKILNKSNIEISPSIKDRIFDFVIWKDNKKAVLLETNYYGGGGTKLKSTAGEYRTLQNLISSDNTLSFIWITDGLGWKTTQNPFAQAFEEIEHTINIKMILKGILERIIIENIK